MMEEAWTTVEKRGRWSSLECPWIMSRFAVEESRYGYHGECVSMPSLGWNPLGVQIILAIPQLAPNQIDL